MNNIQDDFRAGAEAYAQQLRDAKAAKDNPKVTTAENGERFAAVVQARLDQLREESSITDITNA